MSAGVLDTGFRDGASDALDLSPDHVARGRGLSRVRRRRRRERPDHSRRRWPDPRVHDESHVALGARHRDWCTPSRATRARARAALTNCREEPDGHRVRRAHGDRDRCGQRIGPARTCSSWAGRGADVVVNDLGGSTTGDGASSRVADFVVDEIRAAGGSAVALVRLGRRRRRLPAHWPNTTLDPFGRIDAVVHNAGILRNAMFEDMTDERLWPVLQTHLLGAVFLSRAALPGDDRAGYGRLVFTASGSGAFGRPNGANYAAAKAGILGLCNALALEGATHGILANAILPVGFTRLAGAPDAADTSDAAVAARRDAEAANPRLQPSGSRRWSCLPRERGMHPHAALLLRRQRPLRAGVRRCDRGLARTGRGATVGGGHRRPSRRDRGPDRVRPADVGVSTSWSSSGPATGIRASHGTRDRSSRAPTRRGTRAGAVCGTRRDPRGRRCCRTAPKRWRARARSRRPASSSAPSSISCLAAACASGGPAAIMAASRSATANAGASPLSSFIRPSRWASRAPERFAGEQHLLGDPRGTSRGSRWVPPAPGSSPSLISGTPRRARSEATRRSHANASSSPPPNATPSMAATDGVGMLLEPVEDVGEVPHEPGEGLGARRAPRALRCRPPPRMPALSGDHDGADAVAHELGSSAASSAARVSVPMALSRSGRVSVITATASRRSTRSGALELRLRHDGALKPS